MFLNLVIVLYPGVGNNKIKFVGVDRIPIQCFLIRWYVEPIIRYVCSQQFNKTILACIARRYAYGFSPPPQIPLETWCEYCGIGGYLNFVSSKSQQSLILVFMPFFLLCQAWVNFSVNVMHQLLSNSYIISVSEKCSRPRTRKPTKNLLL